MMIFSHVVESRFTGIWSGPSTLPVSQVIPIKAAVSRVIAPIPSVKELHVKPSSHVILLGVVFYQYVAQ
jgi:hypothetical protein